MAFVLAVGLGGVISLPLSSCRDNITDLDLQVAGQQDLAAAELKEFELESYTLQPQQGNISSDNGQLLLSWRNDPAGRTGELESTGFFEVRLPDAVAPPPRLVPGAEIKLRITLPFQLVEREREDTTLDATFELYQIQGTAYNGNFVYFTNDRWNLIPGFDTPTVLDRVEKIRIDTAGRTRASYRTMTFTVQGAVAATIKEYLLSKGWNAKDQEFVQALPGFAIRMRARNHENQQRVPLVVSIGIGSASSAQFIYSDTVKTPRRGVFQRDTTVTDTIAMQLNSDCRHHTFVDEKRLNAQVGQILTDGDYGKIPNDGSRRAYIQGGRPLWAYLRFPGLNAFLETQKNIVLLRAEINLVNDNELGPLPRPPASLLGFRGAPDPLQLTRNLFNTGGILNEDIQNSAINFFYDSANARYSVNVTPLIQSISLGKEANSGVTMAVPASNYAFRTFTFNTNPASEKRSKMRIYYVNVNKGN